MHVYEMEDLDLLRLAMRLTRWRTELDSGTAPAAGERAYFLHRAALADRTASLHPESEFIAEADHAALTLADVDRATGGPREHVRQAYAEWLAKHPAADPADPQGAEDD